MFNKERFHNQLALSIGYKLINDKRFTLEVEDSDDPWVTLKVEGCDDVKFKASNKSSEENMNVTPEIKIEIESIIDATRQAYITTINSQY